MKTIIQKLEQVFDSGTTPMFPHGIQSKEDFLILRRALFLLAHEIDELKDIK